AHFPSLTEATACWCRDSASTGPHGLIFVPFVTSGQIRARAALRVSLVRVIGLSSALNHPANSGAENEVPLHSAKPLRKSSGSGDWRTRPSRVICAIGIEPPLNGGTVLITDAPGACARTHGPALLNIASEPFGL